MDPSGFSREAQARLFLFVACLWPLWVLALFGASSNASVGTNQLHVHNNHINDNGVPESSLSSSSLELGAVSEDGIPARTSLRSMLDRVDVVGYGPTHPRVAVVVVGEDAEDLRDSVESVFRNTDLNRIFLIIAVLDGEASNPRLVEDLAGMDHGGVPHWHGSRPDLHPGDDKQQQGEDPHGGKVHAMFHPEKIGVAASRARAVEFVHLLEHKHIEAGLKSPQEDLILVLLQAGSQFDDRKWLPAVTQALIVPPPILRGGDEGVALKLANAVSLRLEEPGMVTSFDERFVPLLAHARAADINSSSGESYATPALNGGGLALRMHTFLNLPVHDESLGDLWSANLELALNLWLCADGIDIVRDADLITSFRTETLPNEPLGPEEAARFAAVWMSEPFRQRFFQAYSSEITRLDWETKVQRAKQSPSFPKQDVVKRCRSFEWYAKEVNTNLGKVLDQKEWGKREAAAAKGAIKKEEIRDAIPARKTPEEIHADAKRAAAGKRAAADHEEPPPEEQPHARPPPLEEEDENRPKPKIPLREENLEIVRQAPPVDVAYVPVHGGHVEHPHMGAMDENGELGYVHDETALRSNPPAFGWSPEEEKASCKKRDNNHKMMTRRVFVDMDYDKKQNEAGVKRDKIFCLVYTTESGHGKIPNIRQTWGPRCDGFMVGSTKTDKSIDAVEIPHEGKEEYDNIWQKVRSMWSYVYDNYYEKYDWFHIGGDDLFLLVENLRYYLESEEIRTASNGGIYLPFGNETVQTPLVLGRRFAYQGKLDEIFDSGGSGYTMNKAALKLLVTEGFPNYFPHAHTFSEDTMAARLFRKMGVFPYDTQDENHSERYMPFMPGHHWGYRLPKDPDKDWYAKYSIHINEGPEHCAPRSLAFHYVKDENMKRLFALAYKLCPAEYMKG